MNGVLATIVERVNQLASRLSRLETRETAVYPAFLDASDHFRTQGTTPGIAAGPGAGTGPTVTIAGSDEAGNILVTTGTAPTANAVVATITFAAPFGSTPRAVLLTPANPAAAALGASQVFAGLGALGTTAWSFQSQSGAALAASTAYRWWYHVVG